MTQGLDILATTPLPALRTALAAVAPEDLDAAVALVRPVLADTAWLDGVLADLIALSRDDPWFRPRFPAFDSGMQQGLLLYSDPHVAIFIGCGARDRLGEKRLGARGGVFAIPGTFGLMRVLRGGDAMLSLWHGGWRDGALQTAARAAGTHRLVDGETITVDGRTTGFIVEHVTGDMVLLHATFYAQAAPTLCEYDEATLALAGTGAAVDGASRSQMLATLLAELDHDDPDAFAAASRRPEPFARWSAMRAWTASRPRAARARLAEMAANDPDAELRGLASATLALIDERCRA